MVQLAKVLCLNFATAFIMCGLLCARNWSSSAIESALSAVPVGSLIPRIYDAHCRSSSVGSLSNLSVIGVYICIFGHHERSTIQDMMRKRLVTQLTKNNQLILKCTDKNVEFTDTCRLASIRYIFRYAIVDVRSSMNILAGDGLFGKYVNQHNAFND